MGKTFAASQSVRLPLEDGEWIEVKPDLSVGDMKRIRRIMGGSEDAMLWRLAYIFVRIVAWSFKQNGQSVEVTEDAFDALATDRMNQIGEAIGKFVGGEEQEKNPSSGERVSETTSPSVG